MVANANDLAGKLQAMLSGTGDGGNALELRSKVGQLNFSAGRWADRNGCDCQACNWLREANDLMMSEATPAKGAPVASDDPQ